MRDATGPHMEPKNSRIELVANVGPNPSRLELELPLRVTSHTRYASRRIVQCRADEGIDGTLECFGIGSVCLAQEPFPYEPVDLRYV